MTIILKQSNKYSRGGDSNIRNDIGYVFDYGPNGTLAAVWMADRLSKQLLSYLAGSSGPNIQNTVTKSFKYWFGDLPLEDSLQKRKNQTTRKEKLRYNFV